MQTVKGKVLEDFIYEPLELPLSNQRCCLLELRSAEYQAIFGQDFPLELLVQRFGSNRSPIAASSFSPHPQAALNYPSYRH